MTHQRIALALIMGDAYNKEELKKLGESVSPWIDGLFVSYNGNKKKTPRLGKFFPGLPIVVERMEWIDDFAAARNHSFSLVPKDAFDWMLWLDTDDVLKGGEHIQDMLAGLDEYTRGVMLRYDYAIEPKTGKVVVDQWRERFLRTDAPWEWRFAVHEVCNAGMFVQMAHRKEVWVEHLRSSGDERGARVRNRRILAKKVRENPVDPRYLFYFAAETMSAMADTENPVEREEIGEAAILAYRKYMMAGEIEDDLFVANLRIAEIQYQLGRYNDAIDTALQGIKLKPAWPDGYVMAAKCAMELNDWERMYGFANVAVECEPPTTVGAHETLQTDFLPFLMRGIAQQQRGNLEEAINDLEVADNIWSPPDGNIKYRIKLIMDELDNPPEDKKELRKSLRGTKPEKSIAFFSAHIPEPWHPLTKDTTGAGGAETMIMELAPRFAADGWRTVVYGTPPKGMEGIYEGVEYWDMYDFSPEEPFTVLVSSRSVEALRTNVAAKHRILWMHDVNGGPGDPASVDAHVVALTNWHANHLLGLYPNLRPENMSVIPNGVDIGRWPKPRIDGRNDPKFIYASSYDRGLEVVLSMWPNIVERWPKAELDVYYGWNMLNAHVQRGDKYLEKFQNEMIRNMALIRKAGIGKFEDHGRVGPKELSEAHMAASVWLYPTSFMETNCITAVEMQAAGVLPLCSNLAALQETVAVPYLKLEGWPLNVDYQRRFLSMLDSLLDDSETGEALRRQARRIGRAHAERYDWSQVYPRWTSLIERLQNG